MPHQPSRSVAGRDQEVGELLPQLSLQGVALGAVELALRGLLSDSAPLSPASLLRLVQTAGDEVGLMQSHATLSQGRPPVPLRRRRRKRACTGAPGPLTPGAEPAPGDNRCRHRLHLQGAREGVVFAAHDRGKLPHLRLLAFSKLGIYLHETIRS